MSSEMNNILLFLSCNFLYWLFVCVCVLVFFNFSGHFWLLSRIISSTWWFRSASRRLDKASSTVQFLLTSSGNDTLYNGTFLFLAGSVVRPEEVLFSKPQLACSGEVYPCQTKSCWFRNQWKSNIIFLCFVLSYIILMYNSHCVAFCVFIEV